MTQEYDELLKTVGEFGKYQKIIYFLVCLIGIPAAFNTMGIVFLAGAPDHWCHVPELDTLDLPRDVLLNLTIPTEEKDGKILYQKCKQYDVDYTGWDLDRVQQALKRPRNQSTKSCTNGWTYDRSQYQSTIVTDWDLVCDKEPLMATASSVYMAGLMVGVILFGTVSDWIGRKPAFGICLVCAVGFAIVTSFSPNYIAFVILRFLTACGGLGLFTTGFVIGIELVGPSWRTFTGIVLEFYWAFGYMGLAGIAYGIRKWSHLALVTSVPLVLLFLLLFIIPESPRWLYTHNKHEKADEIVRKMAKVNKVELPDKLDVVVKEEPQAFVWDLFRYPKLRLRTINIFFNWAVNSLVYYGLSLNTSSLGGNDYIDFLISGAVEVPAYLFCLFALNPLGRRWTLSGTMVIAGVALLCTLAVPTDRDDLNWIIITLAQTGKLCISASFAIIYVFSAELFPTVVRNVGVGAGSFWARIGGILAPQIARLSVYSRFIPLITFGVASVAAGLLALALPETAHKTLPETMLDGENFGSDKPKKEPTIDTEQGEVTGYINPTFSPSDEKDMQNGAKI